MLWAPGHTSKVFDMDALPTLARDTVHWLRKLKKRLGFNTIAVSGHSGLILGALVAERLKMPLLAVRKADDKQCVDGHRVNGTRLADCRYIVLDDLIDSGATLKRIVTEIEAAAKKENDWRYRDAMSSLYYDEYRYIQKSACMTEEQALEHAPIPHPRCVGVFLFSTHNKDHYREEYPHPLRKDEFDPATLSVFHLSYLTRHGGLL